MGHGTLVPLRAGFSINSIVFVFVSNWRTLCDWLTLVFHCRAPVTELNNSMYIRVLSNAYCCLLFTLRLCGVYYDWLTSHICIRNWKRGRRSTRGIPIDTFLLIQNHFDATLVSFASDDGEVRQQSTTMGTKWSRFDQSNEFENEKWKHNYQPNDLCRFIRTRQRVLKPNATVPIEINSDGICDMFTLSHCPLFNCTDDSPGFIWNEIRTPDWIGFSLSSATPTPEILLRILFAVDGVIECNEMHRASSDMRHTSIN